ncbi:hypothetical protein MtrunA17_Chr8g0363881 [Medicago truncatula]|uniref:Uncharacterized protein n=1 Tax=Medicago truncatula TaxID=3880 RepID=A0A396GJF9_MEDTR|nr:hypothetical protein MtrunA17_Chr8g0363881 [Medicago truncatula]
MQFGSLLKYKQLSKTSRSSLVKRKMDSGNFTMAVLSAASVFSDLSMPMFSGNAFNLEHSERMRLSRCFSPDTSLGSSIKFSQRVKFKLSNVVKLPMDS